MSFLVLSVVVVPYLNTAYFTAVGLGKFINKFVKPENDEINITKSIQKIKKSIQKLKNS